jgi:hypothetical protein
VPSFGGSLSSWLAGVTPSFMALKARVSPRVRGVLVPSGWRLERVALQAKSRD